MLDRSRHLRSLVLCTPPGKTDHGARRTIEVRNPYVYPMKLVQVELLRQEKLVKVSW